MKPYLLGFAVGCLMASAQMTLLLLMTPFFVLLASVLSKAVFRFVVSLTLGLGWVAAHEIIVNYEAVPVSKVSEKVTLIGITEAVRQTRYKTIFDFNTKDGALKVSCYRCQFQVQEGDRWKLRIRQKPFISLNNPGGFDYRRWVLSKGYIASGTVDSKSKNNIKLSESYPSIKQTVSSVVAAEKAPLIRALLLGDKTGINGPQMRAINRAGITHLFVVSGLHIGLAAMMVVFIVGYLLRPLLIFKLRGLFHISLLAGLLLSVVYAFVSGMNTPAIRALIMLIISMYVIWGNRSASVFDYWLLALMFVLIVSPLAFIGVGAWLSFGIVLALVFGMSGLNLAVVDSGARNQLSHVKLKFKRFLYGLLRAQWFAFCAGGIILVAFQMPLSIISLGLNLVLIPLVSCLLVPLAFVGTGFALAGDLSLILFCESILQTFLNWLLEWPVEHTFSFPVHTGNHYLVMLALCLLLLPKAMKVYLLACCLLVIALVIKPERPMIGGFNATILDVGQGSSAIIETHRHTMVVDTGYGRDNQLGMADYVVLPVLRNKGIQTLNMVFLTHEDADHAGGLEALKPIAEGVTRQSMCPNQVWHWDDVEFTQFQSTKYQSGNNGSCLLKITALDGDSILFAGDIEKKAEMNLIDDNLSKLSAEVLVVPHHGSKTSSGLGFIDAVDPALALISAGRLNHFGHPHSEVIKRYEDRLVKIYSTASHGAIEVEFSPRQAARIVSTYRPIDQYEK